MPAWGLQDGGSLNQEEIAELATWIMNAGPRWNEVEGLVAAGAPTPIVPETGTGADAAARGIFLSKGCGACHTIRGLGGAVGNVGPELTQVGTVAGTRKPGTPAPDYIRESILTPSAFLVPGFQNLMLPFQGQITDTELSALVDYLSRLGTGETSGGAPGGAVTEGGAASGSGTAPATGGAGQPSPAQVPGGQVTTPSATVLPGTSVPIGAPTQAAP
jgi:mono/diheme cytochrome c family protein